MSKDAIGTIMVLAVGIGGVLVAFLHMLYLSRRGVREAMPHNESVDCYYKNLHEPLANPRDLAVVGQIVELALLCAYDGPGKLYTREELCRLARDLSGAGMPLEQVDLDAVLEQAVFLDRVDGRFRLRGDNENLPENVLRES